MKTLLITKEEIFNDFIDSMKKELKENEHKGCWLEYSNIKNQNNIINEIDYHFSKLEDAYFNQDTSKIKEYCSDIANICMFLFTSYNNQ